MGSLLCSPSQYGWAWRPAWEENMDVLTQREKTSMNFHTTAARKEN